MDVLLNEALQLVRDVTATKSKEPMGASGVGRKYNELKKGWRELSNSTDAYLLKRIREG